MNTYNINISKAYTKHSFILNSLLQHRLMTTCTRYTHTSNMQVIPFLKEITVEKKKRTATSPSGLILKYIFYFLNISYFPSKKCCCIAILRRLKRRDAKTHGKLHIYIRFLHHNQPSSAILLWSLFINVRLRRAKW